MDYSRIYIELIERAKDRVLEGYSEKHHVVPRCMGGDDKERNLVKLTPEEHYLAHQLLVKIYPKNFKLLSAVVMMCSTNGTLKRSNKLYGWLRRNFSESHRGEKHHQFNKPLSSEVKEKISNTLKGRVPWNKGKITGKRLCKSTPAWNKGLKMTDEYKRINSESHKGISNGPQSPEHIAKRIQARVDTCKKRKIVTE